MVCVCQRACVWRCKSFKVFKIQRRLSVISDFECNTTVLSVSVRAASPHSPPPRALHPFCPGSLCLPPSHRQGQRRNAARIRKVVLPFESPSSEFTGFSSNVTVPHIHLLNAHSTRSQKRGGQVNDTRAHKVGALPFRLCGLVCPDSHCHSVSFCSLLSYSYHRRPGGHRAAGGPLMGRTRTHAYTHMQFCKQMHAYTKSKASVCILPYTPTQPQAQ